MENMPLEVAGHCAPSSPACSALSQSNGSPRGWALMVTPSPALTYTSHVILLPNPRPSTCVPHLLQAALLPAGHHTHSSRTGSLTQPHPCWDPQTFLLRERWTLSRNEALMPSHVLWQPLSAPSLLTLPSSKWVRRDLQGGRTDGWMDGWMGGWMGACIAGWVDGWVDGWMDG